MVAVVKIDENGFLVKIKEVSDIYRYEPYSWDEDELYSSLSSLKKLSSED
jgi:hypothetical protein